MRASAAILLSLLLSACTSVSYYAHVLQGGWQVLRAREPIQQILADASTDSGLKAKLGTVQAARRFAVVRLGLPDNGSYTSYSRLSRPYVVWNVFAAPALSLQPVTHCFLVAGCVAYRGYYSESLARAEAARLQAQGYETAIGGVSAYSTLGWFDDPVLSTMLAWDDEQLAATLFHELAHQLAYVLDDTSFNESYAQFVEHEGLRSWRQSRGLSASLPPNLAFEEVFIARLLQTREALQALYDSPVDDAGKRAGKSAAFAELKADIARLSAEQGLAAVYAPFLARPMNNATLLPFGLYHQWQAAFSVLFAEHGGDWPRFHVAVQALAKLDAAARRHRLEALDAQAVAPIR